MKEKPSFLQWSVLVLWGLLLVSCSGTRELSREGYHAASVQPAPLVAEIPDYRPELQSLRGMGRAIVSEPGNTERVTIRFASNRQKSLVNVRSGIGIEGGELLTDGDTLLVYNKVDKIARKIPVHGGQLKNINKLASLNILNMINYPVTASEVRNVLENESHYKLLLSNSTEVFVEKKSKLVQQVIQPPESPLPYSKITYDAYASLEGFKLPRRITIFGADERSKIALQLTSLEVNPKLDTLTINIPDNIPVYHR